MWEVLEAAIKNGGLSGFLIAGLAVFYAVSIRALWNQNQALHRQLREVQEEYTSKLTELQERRIEEKGEVTERVINHLALVDRTMDKVVGSLDVIVDITRGCVRR